ncbi:hypothetical protein EYF80_014107 [Liparis tanakae]|uniref:Uncharacterized protein n=1 Tax=Liparis tanakae TaxID=230148 RepID=A0A4Z2IE89_9TELE|nr:hypothetical protein EYF80_014107 [Liparis tanakae]
MFPILVWHTAAATRSSLQLEALSAQRWLSDHASHSSSDRRSGAKHEAEVSSRRHESPLIWRLSLGVVIETEVRVRQGVEEGEVQSLETNKRDVLWVNACPCLKVVTLLSGQSVHQRDLSDRLRKTLHEEAKMLVQDTYVKTSVPQPAVSVKRRGPRSRAGLMAAPQLADIDMEIPRTIVATIGGISFGGAGEFLSSFKLRMHNISMPVPTT